MAARVLVLSLLAACVVSVSSASATSSAPARLFAVQDVSLPFWCDWGYEADERCYRDDGERLPVGGDDDKVWRAALRFVMSSIPPGAAVQEATLRLFHDGRCLAPRKKTRPCDGRPYVVEALPILSPDWFREREVDLGYAVAETELGAADLPRWVGLDLTSLVSAWIDGTSRNAGVMVKLSNDHEDFGSSGPAFASSSAAYPARRPVLEVTFTVPG